MVKTGASLPPPYRQLQRQLARLGYVSQGSVFERGPGQQGTHEEPVLFSQCGRTDGIFHQVVVDLHPAILEINVQRGPLVQRIINGAAQEALREMSASAEFKL